MENITLIWFLRPLTISALLFGIYFLAEPLLKKTAKKHITAKKRRQELQKACVRINQSLLASGMNHDRIMDFWKDCYVEAEIQGVLPPCTCKDVNQCETWCQAKARFKMNPPD